jgi:hypothetical protein
LAGQGDGEKQKAGTYCAKTALRAFGPAMPIVTALAASRYEFLNGRLSRRRSLGG